MKVLHASRILRMFRGIPGKSKPMDTWEITQALRANGHKVTEAEVSSLLAKGREDQRELGREIRKALGVTSWQDIEEAV